MSHLILIIFFLSLKAKTALQYILEKKRTESTFASVVAIADDFTIQQLLGRYISDWFADKMWGILRC